MGKEATGYKFKGKNSTAVVALFKKTRGDFNKMKKDLWFSDLLEENPSITEMTRREQDVFQLDEDYLEQAIPSTQSVEAMANTLSEGKIAKNRREWISRAAKQKKEAVNVVRQQNEQQTIHTVLLHKLIQSVDNEEASAKVKSIKKKLAKLHNDLQDVELAVAAVRNDCTKQFADTNAKLDRI